MQFRDKILSIQPEPLISNGVGIEKGMEDLPGFYCENSVEVVASLCCIMLKETLTSAIVYENTYRL